MSVLIACEESQRVTAAFRIQGIEAFSCDLLPTSGTRPDWHIQADVTTLLSRQWDAIIAFPPCTHLSASGARWWPEKRADGRQQAAVEFFMAFVNAPCRRVAIENPVGIMSRLYRKPDQIIQPWHFGEGEVKTTCLWLRGLPPLMHTKHATGRKQRVWRMPPSSNRATERSKTYQCIADAMAMQWQTVIRKGAT